MATALGFFGVREFLEGGITIPSALIASSLPVYMKKMIASPSVGVLRKRLEKALEIGPTCLANGSASAIDGNEVKKRK